MISSTRRSILRASLSGNIASMRTVFRALASTLGSGLILGPRARGADRQVPITAEQVEKAIRLGVHYIKSRQQPDGSWPNPHFHHQHTAGPTSLAVYAMLMAGEPVDSPPVTAGLRYLEQFSPEQIDGSYSVGLLTMVYARIDPVKYAVRIAANVAWLEQVQIREGDGNPGWPGSWTHTSDKRRRGDNSSTQFALLGLNAAAQVGIPVKKEVWALTREFLRKAQRPDGGWSYYPNVSNSTSTGSMTCAGISSSIIVGLRLSEGGEQLVDDKILQCGKQKVNPAIRRGLEWLDKNFSVARNPGSPLPGQWKHYYLYGMERVGRFCGIQYIGSYDWYREGAKELIATQDILSGSWTGIIIERESFIATSFAVMFLATGRSPVLFHKLRHGPGEDWNNDPDDIRNLVAAVSDDWKHILTWQVVDPETASLEQMLQAPISYLNGHEPPTFTAKGKANLRDFVEQGGVILAEACCGDPRFDQGFRALIKEIFPEDGVELRPLSEDHPIWRTKHLLSPDVHPLWGIDHGCRTSVIYSPKDLSCYWNKSEAQPTHPKVMLALRLGQNIVDYVTGRELPADKLTIRTVQNFKSEPAKRGALRIAKLRHAGDWNVAPLAIPSLAASLRATGIDAVINHKELVPADPNLIHYPLIYIHGRTGFSFSEEDIAILRRHIEPGGGTFYADAACGSPAFDAAFRKFAATMLPDSPLVPIPREDDLYSTKVGYDLSEVRYTKASGGGHGPPQLEGIDIDGRWVVIYSRLDIGCALERSSSTKCKGYVHESALKIATNIVIYSTLP